MTGKLLSIPDDEGVFTLKPWDQPHGITYRWFRAFDGTMEDEIRMMQLEEAGWSPVPAERHEGRWMPHGYEGPIQVYGMILMERALRVH